MCVCVYACASANIIEDSEGHYYWYLFCLQPEWFHSLPTWDWLDSALYSDPNFWNCICIIFLWVRKTLVQLRKFKNSRCIVAISSLMSI